MDTKNYVLKTSGSGTRVELIESLLGIVSTLLTAPEEQIEFSEYEDDCLITYIELNNESDL